MSFCTFRLWPAAVILAALVHGCFTPSEQRAERDLQVGKASAAGASVVVQHGHAAVRDLSAGNLVLWASAPAFDVDMRIESGASKAWTIALRNAMPSAELRVSNNGAAVQAVLVEAPIPTRKKWRFEVEPPAQVSLRVGPPEAQVPAPFRFAVLSDVQDAVDRVQDIFGRIDREGELAFVLTSGDLTDRGTADQMDRFQHELRSLGIPVFGTLGNHDAFASPTPWHGRFGRCSLHFRYRGIAFTAVDSADGTLDPMVYDWLAGWLEGARREPHVVITHIPILDPIGVRGGGFASRNEAAKLLSLLAQGRVDVTFYGHIHSYYAFDNAGIPAYISGGGGAIPERFDGVGRHFLVVEARPVEGIVSVDRIDVD